MASIHTGDPAKPDLAKAPRWQTYTHGHHWRNAHDEFDGAKMGMWLFLTTEVLLFAGLFVAYAVFRMKYPEAFVAGSHHLSIKWGFINTVILLVSSFTVAYSIRCAQLNKQGLLKLNLLITIACGFAFLFIKGTFEYYPKLMEGKAPGWFFSYPYAESPWEPIWWGLYYCATGVHALHVIIGMGLLFWVYLGARKGKYGPTHYTGVEITGLYWHLVDLIWIFLFPLLYLIH